MLECTCTILYSEFRYIFYNVPLLMALCQKYVLITLEIIILDATLCYIQKRLLNKNMKLSNIGKKCRVFKKCLHSCKNCPLVNCSLYSLHTQGLHFCTGEQCKSITKSPTKYTSFLLLRKDADLHYISSSRRMLRLFHYFHAFLCACCFFFFWSFWLFSTASLIKHLVSFPLDKGNKFFWTYAVILHSTI